MSAAKHTAGEWEAFDNRGDPDFDKYDAGLIGVGVVGDAPDIAHCNGFTSSRSVEEVLANARLIAAAPELKEAAEQAHGAVRQFLAMVDAIQKFQALPIPKILEIAQHNCPIILQAIDAALAKAEGRS